MPLVDSTSAFDPNARTQLPDTPTLESVLRLALITHGQHLRVAMPVKVVKVRSSHRVDLQPLFQAQYLATKGPTTLPIIPGAPVAMPGGASWQVLYPINVGDVGLAVFTDRALDAFMASDGSPADPADSRLHDLTDAVYMPGLAVDTLAQQRNDTTNDLVLRNGTAEVRLERNGTFRVYSNTDQTVELVDLVGQLAQHCTDLVQTLQQAMTVTMMGPSGFWGPTQGTLSTALSKVQTITRQINQLKGS